MGPAQGVCCSNLLAGDLNYCSIVGRHEYIEPYLVSIIIGETQYTHTKSQDVLRPHLVFQVWFSALASSWAIHKRTRLGVTAGGTCPAASKYVCNNLVVASHNINSDVDMNVFIFHRVILIRPWYKSDMFNII